MSDDTPKIAGAPGLIMRKSANGFTATWQCRSDLARKGYPIKSQRVLNVGATVTDAERVLIMAKCISLQNEMLAWSRGGPVAVPTGFDGTLESLIRCYETRPTSAFHELRHESKQIARQRHTRLIKDYGTVCISEISLDLVTEWREKWIQQVRANRPNNTNPQAGMSMANTLVDTLRQLLIFGASRLKDQACKIARAELHDSKFRKPKRAGDSDSEGPRMLREHVIAFRRTAHAMGHHEMALAAAIQFDCGFRQKDVIGGYAPKDDNKSPPSDVIRENEKWVYGVRWNEIAMVGNATVLNHVTSKRSKRWKGNIAVNVMTMEEFSALPQPLPSTGPVIIDPVTGWPYRSSRFRKLWRRIADKAGIPREVCNMHNRAGALTEAFDGKAAPDFVRKFGTHSELKTTLGYNRSSDEAIDEVMAIRNRV